MTKEQYERACEDAQEARLVYKQMPVDADTANETLEHAIEEFEKFESTPESIKAIHEAGKMPP
jgi:hypothetical protein